MTARLGVRWRMVALAGAAAGLALAPLHPPPALAPALLVGLTCVVAALRPRTGERGSAAWLAVVACLAALAGLAVGGARVAAIDSGALEPRIGEAVELRGFVASPPRLSAGATIFTLATAAGRVGVETPIPTQSLEEGREVVVEGIAEAPAPWREETLARTGTTRIVAAHRVEATSRARGGVRGAFDAIRRRAEAALERGTPPASAALLRGFVLGQDDRIPEDVREEFRRSGLAHILAVSGQNVMLLVLLATPILALAGIPWRVRLVALCALVAVYVPVAGAGASIQRAGVMGAAGLVAALAGRPSARWYALLLAAAITLAINPRATTDVGWQLSFAAVAGLLALARPLAQLLMGSNDPGPMRRMLSEGAAMTVAATLATAPLAAHHFDVTSLTAVPANLVALPAIAPAMWLGMLAGALGQLPSAPVEPLTWLGGLCAGYIGWAARAFGGEPAQLEIDGPGMPVALALTVGLLVAARLSCLALARRTTLAPAWRGPARRSTLAVAGVLATALTASLLLSHGPHSDDTASGGPPPALTIRALDVGQGDAILLEPRGAEALLVDTGPPGGAAAERLAELGIERLAALFVTHDELDHSGALPELLSRLEVERLVAAQGVVPEHCRFGACPPLVHVSAGQTIRAGRTRIDALWPPAVRAPPDGDPNARSLVLRVRSGNFDALLTGDAEAELAPVDPGAVELLKIAHHGSADAGLPLLLERASPALAVVSVGAGNPHGHPAPETLTTLARAEVAVRRTDEAGEVVVAVRGGRWSVE